MDRVVSQTLAGIYVVGTWVYGVMYIWTHWAGFWQFGILAFYAFIRAIFWPIILAASLFQGPSGVSPQAMGITAPHASAYSTTGSATIETCKGAGIQQCSTTKTSIPTAINSAEAPWRGVWHEQKPGGRIMCYQHLESSFLSTQSLRFECKPVSH